MKLPLSQDRPGGWLNLRCSSAGFESQKREFTLTEENLDMGSKMNTKQLLAAAVAKAKAAGNGMRWMTTPEGREFNRRVMKRRIRNGYDPGTAARGKSTGAIRARNQAIRNRLAAGVLPAEVAAEFALTPRRIEQIRNYLPGGHARIHSSPKANGTLPSQETKGPEHEAEIAYVYGRIESQLEVYASQLGIPFTELASGISRLLRDKAVRSVLGPSHRMSRVR